MKVTIKHHTPLWVCSDAIRTCWDSGEKSDTVRTYTEYGEEYPIEEIVCGEKDLELIDRVGNKFKHASTLEHLTYNFYIEGISRACLQELARHRMASLSVKSTRYTLKELKEEKPFLYEPNKFGDLPTGSKERASKYLVFTDVELVNSASVYALEALRSCLFQGISNDIAKYCLPESYKTSLSWSINARSLQNFLSLRSDKAALWEIRNLTHAVYEAIPEEHRYLFSDYLKEYGDDD